MATKQAQYRTPEERFVLQPVGWLLGPELVAQLGKILRRRANPRDWMPYYRGAAHDECWQRNGTMVCVNPADALDASAPRTSAADPMPGAERAVGPAPAPAPSTPAPSPDVAGAGTAGAEDCWFDYLSDSGDAGDAMYAVAYATMTSFACTIPLDQRTTWSARQAPVRLSPLLATAERTPGALPVGQFVFFGGDTAYHVADAATLKARLRTPFDWAFCDAQQNGHIAQTETPEDRKRRLYGIPGNHDWYDNLEGFSLVFRLGAPRRTERDAAHVEVIELPQLERVQLASYLAIQLPYGWQLWGLDIDSPLDSRQCEYFRSLGKPDKLILATASPAIAFGTTCPSPEHVEALSSLDLGLPPDTRPACRLDLSGDVHHYARYYPRATTAPAKGGYGSVVSGLGGAFHHPSFTQLSASPAERIEPERLYPTAKASRRDVGAGLLSARAAWFGSWVRLVPMALTMILGFATTRSVGGAWLLDQLFGIFPGCVAVPRLDGRVALSQATCAVGVFVFAIMMLVWAFRLGHEIYAGHAESPSAARNFIDLLGNRKLDRISLLRELVNPRRSYWLPWVVGLIAFFLFAFYPYWGPGGDTTLIDGATLVVVVGLPLGLAVVAWKLGADGLRGLPRIAIGAAGFVHGLAQIVVPLMFARLFAVATLPCALGVSVIVVVAAALSPRLARPAFRSDRAGGALVIALLALVVLAAVVAAAIGAVHGRGPVARPWWEDAWRFGLASLATMPLGTIWFTWYLAVAARLDGHNNEVGGTARVTKYRQLIRFHVHAGGLTGYVIAIENTDARVGARCAGANLGFWLVDVFTMSADATSSGLRPDDPLGPVRATDLSE